jgi:glycosyltransferase involved in cell wall biosynthesis
VLQSGVYAQELLTALLQRGTVAVSDNARRFNPFVRRVIPNGVDLDAFRPDAAIKSRHPTILFVGALSGRKRGAWLLDQFDRVIRARFPDAQLHMVTAAGPASSGVTYHCGITSASLVRLYQSSWVYASPSTYEGFGLPYLEALACGTPVVATPNPGSREVLDHGRFGVLAADDRFADEVCRLLSDAQVRQRLACEGVERAAEYDMARTALRYEQLIQERVASSRRLPRQSATEMTH